MSTHVLRIFLFALSLVGCNSQVQEKELARGAELLKPFKAELQSALRTGLEQGPIEAIDACRVKAPEIAAELSRGDTRLGRSSHRLRNPLNASPEWVSPVLQAYLDDDANRASRAVPLPNGRWGYVEPIVTQPLCLTCHGKAVPAEVTARIRVAYPEDRAVDFDAGDLRGVFWIEFSAEN